MSGERRGLVVHPMGEQPEVAGHSAVADTFAGRVHIEWDATAPVTPFGQLPFFIDYLKQAGLFDRWVDDCPLLFTSPNAPRKRDLLGTVLLSVLAGHRRYAHVTALRCDPVNPPLLGMRKVVSEDSVRRNLEKIDEAPGLAWLRNHLDYCTMPLLDALPGDQHNVAHATAGLWELLDHLGPQRWPSLLRGDKSWGIEAVMARAEQKSLPYLFRLRMTKNVRRALDRAMATSDWTDAGRGWQGKETSLRLEGWSRQRRVILLRRRVAHPPAIDHGDPAQRRLSFIEVGADQETWGYAALVTSLDDEILTLGQLYRDRADCENAFDELKNQWGWGGFTTQDLTRCRLLAGIVALTYNWWSLFVRLADPEHHREAITTRPLLLSAIAQRTQHAGQVRLTISSAHGARDKARYAYLRIAGFLDQLRRSAEQLDPLQRWYRILSEALRHFLHGRQLQPPLRLNPA